MFILRSFTYINIKLRSKYHENLAKSMDNIIFGYIVMFTLYKCGFIRYFFIKNTIKPVNDLDNELDYKQIFYINKRIKGTDILLLITRK